MLGGNVDVITHASFGQDRSRGFGVGGDEFLALPFTHRHTAMQMRDNEICSISLLLINKVIEFLNFLVLNLT